MEGPCERGLSAQAVTKVLDAALCDAPAPEQQGPILS